MRLLIATLASVACLAFASQNVFAQDYLTAGPRTQKLKIVQLQGGFAGFTGTQYTIEPDGTWMSEMVFNKKLTPKGNGKLTEKEMAKLAGVLEKYKLDKLPEKSGKEPGANPHTITFEFGDKKASLVGQGAPKLDPQNPGNTVESRFAGIWSEITAMLKSEKE